MHSDVLASVILRASGYLSSKGQTFEAESLAKLNKVLHGLDFFPREVLPPGVLLVHPIGAVIGRVSFKQFTVIYQGVTVGGHPANDEDVRYPLFNGPAVLFSGATVLGGTTVGAHVAFAANSMVIDEDIPAGALVVGQYPNHRILAGRGERISEMFFNFSGNLRG